MTRSLAVATILSLMMTTLLWVAEVPAKRDTGGFRGGTRAARGDDAGSRVARDGGARDSSVPDAPVAKKPPKPRAWTSAVRGLLLGGLIGGLFFGRGFGGIGLLEVLILSALILLAFRALSTYQPAPAGRYAAAGAYGGGGSFLGSTAGGTATVQESRDALARAMNDIQQSDPAFDPPSFARIVDDTFRRVQAAWTARDMGRAAEVLSVEMREELERQCDRLKSARRINRVERIALRRAALIEVRQEHGWDWVAVHIVANVVDYTTDEGGLRVLEGNPFEPVELEERWEFLRPSGPNPWSVSAIR